jgi:anti-sigma factor RsiW
MDPQREAQFEQISAYLDGELTAAQSRQVEHWLAEDPELRRFYEGACRLNLAANVPTAAPRRVDLSAQILEHIDRTRRWLSGTAAAAAVLAVSLVGYWLNPTDESRLPTDLAAAPPLIGRAVEAERVQVLEVARAYVLTDATPIDPYSILLEREGPLVLPAGR